MPFQFFFIDIKVVTKLLVSLFTKLIPISFFLNVCEQMRQRSQDLRVNDHARVPVLIRWSVNVPDPLLHVMFSVIRAPYLNAQLRNCHTHRADNFKNGKIVWIVKRVASFNVFSCWLWQCIFCIFSRNATIYLYSGR